MFITYMWKVKNKMNEYNKTEKKNSVVLRTNFCLLVRRGKGIAR